MEKKLEYIKANGRYYKPQKSGVQNPEMIKGVYFPIMNIKKLLFVRRYKLSEQQKTQVTKNLKCDVCKKESKDTITLCRDCYLRDNE